MNARSLIFGVAAIGLLVGSVLAVQAVQKRPPTKPRAKTTKGVKAKRAKPRRKTPSAHGPNVLVIVWDTARADRMSLYGHGVPTTPGLEQFAANARVYEHAISPATWTVPSHASLFTGLPVTTHGANAKWRWVDHHHVTLAEHLQAHGYETYAYSANPYVSGMTNLLQGFQIKHYSWEHDKSAAKEAAKQKLLPDDRSTEISPKFDGRRPDVAWSHSTFKEVAPLANDKLLRWLDTRSGEQPWFAFMNLMEAHTPRIPAMPARQAVMDEQAIALGLQTELSLWKEVSAILGKHAYTQEELEAIRGVYDATLRELDVQFASLMFQLEKRGLLEDTVVVLTSDHGESLGEHGLWEHRYGVWNTLVHVPLVIRYPRRLKPGREDEPVSTMSIYPTVLDLLELPPPPRARLGRSLTRAKQSWPVYTQLTDPYTSKLGPFKKAYPDVDFTRFLRTFDAMIDNNLKVVRASDGAHELYDLVSDPGEQHNLFGTHPEAGEVLNDLKRWRARIPVADPKKRVPGDRKKGRGKVAEDKAMQRMLESLGYIQE